MSSRDRDSWITVPVISANSQVRTEDAGLPQYEPPSIREAKTYRYMSLPRRVPAANQKTKFRLAREGELTGENGEPSRLYYLCDSSEVLDEFGIGIGLYFKTVKVFFFIFLVCALISLIAMYENKDSNPDADTVDEYKKLFNVTIEETELSLIGSTYGATRDSLKYNKQAASDIACVIVLVVALFVFSKFGEKEAIESIDLAQQTTQDYSVIVKNPPKNITSVEEYRKHFSIFGDIVMISLTRNNGDLLDALAQKRVLSAQLARQKQRQQGGTEVPAWQSFLGIARSVEEYEKRLAKVQRRIDALAFKDYEPWKVFITFDKEEGQRSCLERTGCGWWARHTGFGVPNDAIFNGVPLDVREAPEPSDVIHSHSHISTPGRCLRILLSYCITGVLMIAAYFIIETLSDQGQVGPAIFISLCNAGMPSTLKYLTIMIEAHDTESGMQQSMLVKLVCGRCLVAAVLFYLATPFSDTFDQSRIQQIQNILIADALTAPLIRLCDVYGYFMRYIYGPWVSVTQDHLNMFWQGSDLTLAERYTDMLKTCFVGLYFAVPLPSGLFITAFAMMSTYFVDKHSLFRIWRRQSMMSASMGKFSRYFMVLVVWVHLQISRIYFANWPYGGLAGKASDDQEADCGFFICRTNSDMSEEQKDIVKLYTGASVTGFCVCILYLFFYRIWVFCKKNVLSRSHSGTSQISQVTFRSLRGPTGYIPYIRKEGLLQPILCCEVQKLNTTILPVDSTRYSNVDPQAFSVYNANEFSSKDIDDTYLKVLYFVMSLLIFLTVSTTCNQALFGSVVYYNDESITIAPPSSAPVESNHVDLHVKALPVGWEKRTSADGRPYYVDHNTKTTHWKPPTVSYIDVALGVSAAPVVASSQTADNSGRISSTDDALPYGWEKRTVKSTGKVYYVNHLTKTTQWNHPSPHTA